MSIHMGGHEAQVLHVGEGDHNRTLLVLDSMHDTINLDIPMSLELFITEIEIAHRATLEEQI